MKIGIITHYYNSQNYGGNLQAYALCKFLNNLGYEAEQISFDKNSTMSSDKMKFILSKCYYLLKVSKEKALHPIISKRLSVRKKSLLFFNHTFIPHSREVYNDSTLVNAVDVYDAYITGSDQVWHPNAYCRAYLLDFVPSSKLKISYAASIAKDYLTEEQLAIFRKSLADYNAISVREQNAIDILQPVSPCPIQWTLDPTLLLSREEWDEVSTERIVSAPYLLCYFLGDDIRARSLAIEYATKHKLNIATIPYLNGRYRKCDRDFDAKQLYNISPADFISLIKYADCVFTDSFHATVFSGIYQKEYVVFDRVAETSMGSRINSLMKLYETPERFCNTPEKQKISYIGALSPIDYNRKLENLERMKETSRMFLINYLSKAE